ncbi:MAG: Holliday junction resolvase [Thermoplasmata archaeon]
MAVGKYERELRGILSADRDTLGKVTKTCRVDEKESYMSIEEIPFLVVRAGGSLGMDLIAIRGEISFPIEVKSSKSDVIYFSDEERLTEQAEWMIDVCTTSGVMPLYAFRIKGKRGDRWRIFTLDIPELKKKQRVLQRKIPLVEKTVHGNYKVQWKNGMPLHHLIAYLNHLLR